MELTIEQALRRGVAAYDSGNLQEAEHVYQAILQSQPKHPVANHSLGLIAMSVNQITAALSLFQTALEVNPMIEQFWVSYIDALVKNNQLKDAKKAIKNARKKGFDAKKLQTLLSQSKGATDTKVPSRAQLSLLLEHYQKGRFSEAEKLATSISQEFPSHNFSWKILAAVLGQTGRKSEALHANKTLVVLLPQDAEAHINLGNTFKEVGRLEEAEASYRQAIALKLDFSEAYYNLGVTLKKLGRLEEAELSYTQAIALKPDFAEAHGNLGNTLQEMGKLEEAEASYRQAIALKSGFYEAYYNLGVTLKKMSRLKEAETSYKQAIALKSDFALAHSNLGVTLQELGRLDEAEASLRQAIALKPDYAEAHSNLGVTLQELGRLDEAEVSYTQAIALKPEYAEAYSNLGGVLQELGRLDDAEAGYTQAIVLNPYYAEAYANLGGTLKQLGRLDEAEVSCRQATALKSDFALAHSNLGITLQELGRLDEAEASLRQAIALKPDYAEAHSNLGITLQELGRLDEAEVSYTQAIALKPEYAEAHCNLGGILRELGRLDEAEASVRRSIVLKSDFALAYSYLGVLLYINGDIDSGLINLEKANNIDPNLDDNITILTILQARKARGKAESSADNISNLGYSSEQLPHPIILNRAIDEELITTLYKMNSIKLDEFDNSRISDARYGNGKCSRDFNLFNDDSPTIKSVADDLITIMREEVKADVYITDSFFNILGAGGGTTPHTHLGKLDVDENLNFGKQKYSLVYYLSVGDQNCKDPGILKLYDPSEDILPCEGMIAIFPADRKHSAVYGGEKSRIMIGVNFYSL